MTTYAELRLRIDRGVARGSYRIVATGPAGEALGRFKLPFSDIELENFILRVGSTRRGRRRIDSPEMDLAKTFGTKLFGALFEGDVRELYRSSFAEARSDGHGLRVTLSLTGAPELLQVPWEYMYDHPSFLSISTWSPIVRYLDLPKPRRPLQIELPLRILALVSAPTDFEVIDAQQERSKLEKALAPLIDAGAIAIDWLEEASLRALQRQLRKADYHVFHFIGHGGYDQEADDGVLLFEDDDGRGRRVSGVQLGTMLADEVSLRLAVLNSCEGARSSLQDPFSGVATSLIEREIPAVIGMQFEITDRAAIVFAGEFYSALADGLPVDSSVAEARKAIYADQNDIEWGTPVLFMRVADGRLFDVQAHTPIRSVQPELRADTAALGAVDETQAAEREATGAEAAQVTEATGLAPADAVAATDADERERVAAADAQRAELERLQREADELAEQERAVAAEVAHIREVAEADERERATAAASAAEAERVEQERQQRVETSAAEAAGTAAAAEADRIAAEAARAAAEAERAEQERQQRESAEAERTAAESQRAAAEADRVAAQAAPAAGLIAQTAVSAEPAPIAPSTRVPVPRRDAAAASSVAAGIPEYQARAAGRVALGGVLTMFIAWTWNYLDIGGYDVSPYIGQFIRDAALLSIPMVATVALAERYVPAVRVPDGSLYRFVGGNRLAAAAIEGALVVATIGFVVLALLYTGDVGQDPISFLQHALIGAFTFVIAEAVIARIWRPPVSEPTRPGSPTSS